MLRLPAIVLLAFLTTAAACAFGNVSVVGFRLAGWAWVIMLGAGLLRSVSMPNRVTFPLSIWAPWLLVLGVYALLFRGPGFLQHLAQLICPLVVGIAASTLRPDEKGVSSLFRGFRLLTILLWLVVLARTPVLFSLRLPAYSNLASQTMTALLLACFFVVSYAHGLAKDLVFYAFLALVPILALTRTAMAVALTLLVTTLSPVSLSKRVVYGTLVVTVGLALFFSPRVQHMMFFSGSGTLEDVRWDNPNLATSGRSALWAMLYPGIERSPWFGHGLNACTEVFIEHGLRLRHPHNDWLRILYDYGAVGLAMFLLSVVMQILHLLRHAREVTGGRRVLFHAAASAFIPFMLMMSTDNILVYAQFFGNLHFMVLGLAYGGLERVRQLGEGG